MKPSEGESSDWRRLWLWAKSIPKQGFSSWKNGHDVAQHQTGRNSGVIHSGIYYKPGSLKATFAREGNRSMVEFCRGHGLKHEVCGKVIVATKRADLTLLDRLYRRGLDLRFQAIGTRHLFIALYLFTLLKLFFALCQLHLNTQPAPARGVVWPEPIKLVRQPTPRS